MAQSGVYQRGEGLDWSFDGEWWGGRKWKKLGMAGRQDSNLGIFQQQGFHGNNSANLEGASGYRNQRSKKEPLHLQVSKWKESSTGWRIMVLLKNIGGSQFDEYWRKSWGDQS